MQSLFLYLGSLLIVTMVAAAFLDILLSLRQHGMLPYSERWESTEKAVKSRQRQVASLAKLNKASDLSHLPASIQISATDIFVQKAQDTLVARKNMMYILATISIMIFCTIIFIGIWELRILTFVKVNIFGDPASIEPYSKLFSGPNAWPLVVYFTIRNATLIGLYLFCLYVPASLFRAFLHEGTILENRIHSIRLGRLYVYLKLTANSEDHYIREVSTALSAEEIEKAFGWNIETSTAFKDIDAGAINKSAIGQIAAAVASVFSRRSGGSGGAH